MKLFWVLFLVLGVTGCDPLQQPQPPSVVNFPAHWVDTTIVQDHPSFDLACNTGGEIVGRVYSYGGSDWFAHSKSSRELFDFGLEADFASLNDGAIAVVNAARLRKLCK